MKDAMAEAEAQSWRIDELAQQAGLTVDTIRYYAREGLLEPPEQAGPPPALRPRAPRAARPDPRAPGPALLARRDPGHRRRRPPGPRRPLRHAAAAATRSTSSSSASGARRRRSSTGCATSGCSPTRPSSAARPTTTPTSRCSARSSSCATIGMTARDPRRARRASTCDHFRALQHDVLDMLSGNDNRDVGPRRDRRDPTAAHRELAAPDARRSTSVLNYVHQRTLQRLTLEAVRPRATHTGVGGVRLDDGELSSRRGSRCAPRCRR